MEVRVCVCVCVCSHPMCGVILMCLCSCVGCYERRTLHLPTASPLMDAYGRDLLSFEVPVACGLWCGVVYKEEETMTITMTKKVGANTSTSTSKSTSTSTSTSTSKSTSTSMII